MSEILVRVLADDLSRGHTVAETLRNFADAYVGYGETLLALDRELA